MSATRASAATGAWPERPPSGSCDTTPHTRSRPAPRAPDPPAPSRASDPPTPPPSPRTAPPSPMPAAQPAPAARQRPAPGPPPSASPSCDRTPPTQPHRAASPSSHTPEESPSLPPASSCLASKSRADNNAHPSTGASGQNRGENKWPPMGRSRGHQRGDSVAAYGEVFMATVTRTRHSTWTRGAQIRLGSPKSQGSGGAVPWLARFPEKQPCREHRPVGRFLIIQPSIVVLTNVAPTRAGNYLVVSVALRMTRGHVERMVVGRSAAGCRTGLAGSG